MDGKLSRGIFKKDPEKRGTLDFLLDHVAMFILIIGLGKLLIQNAQSPLGLIVYVASSLLLSAFISTKFRLFAKIKHNPNKHLLEALPKKRPLLQAIYGLQKVLGKYRLVFHPSAVDAEVLVFILFPYFGFDKIFIILGILFVWIDLLFSGIGPVYLILKKL